MIPEFTLNALMALLLIAAVFCSLRTVNTMFILTVTLSVMHLTVAADLGDFAYYFTGAAVCALCAWMLGCSEEVTKGVQQLQKIYGWCALGNAVGWVAYFFWLPAWPYELAFLGLYAWMLAALIDTGMRENVGGIAADRRYTGFFRHIGQNSLDHSQYKGEI